jgi:hypothetical protein
LLPEVVAVAHAMQGLVQAEPTAGPVVEQADLLNIFVTQ